MKTLLYFLAFLMDWAFNLCLLALCFQMSGYDVFGWVLRWTK